MDKKNKLGFLNGTALKLIAMLCMVSDHVGDNFFPDMTWMRIIGRVAMPLFAFCVSEGYIHTHDRKKYLLRMGIFALVSELPFDLVTAGRLEYTHQNIMYTFFLAIAALMIFDRLTSGERKKAGYILGTLAVMIFCAVSLLTGADYNLYGVGIVFLFYVFRNKALWLRDGAAAVWHLLVRNMGIYLWGLLGFIPILFYNGEKGKGLKWLFYAFYPGHLLIIWLVKTYLIG